MAVYWSKLLATITQQCFASKIIFNLIKKWNLLFPVKMFNIFVLWILNIRFFKFYLLMSLFIFTKTTYNFEKFQIWSLNLMWLVYYIYFSFKIVYTIYSYIYTLFLRVSSTLYCKNVSYNPSVYDSKSRFSQNHRFTIAV